MAPITLLALTKTLDILTRDNTLTQTLQDAGVEFGLRMPLLRSNNILVSYAPPEIGDRNVQLTYPRISLASESVANTQEEKFRSFSGSVTIGATILASANLVGEAETWLHYYVDAVTTLLRDKLGDWGDGVFYGGTYEVQFQAPKVGGLGFVQSAKVAFDLLVSRN